jgi:hypothetical protein
MEIFWWIITGLVVVLIIAAWYVLSVRGGLVHRAESAKPEDAAALREIQRQIDVGYTYSAREGMDRNL